MATGGNLRIVGDQDEGDSYPSKMQLVEVISDDEAEKLLFFFNEKLRTEEEKYKLKVDIATKDGPEIRIWGKETDHNTSVAVVERLRSLVIDKVKLNVISGNSDDTFDNVKKIILNYKLKTEVLPIQSKQCMKIVRIFGRRVEELDTIKRAYENPGNPLAEKPSMFHETHTMSRSQGRRAEVRGTGSFTQMDVKYEFDTEEGLHVKLYRKAITKLNVDAIVNAANDELLNIAGLLDCHYMITRLSLHDYWIVITGLLDCHYRITRLSLQDY